jgi:hypothetical protein
MFARRDLKRDLKKDLILPIVETFLGGRSVCLEKPSFLK